MVGPHSRAATWQAETIPDTSINDRDERSDSITIKTTRSGYTQIAFYFTNYQSAAVIRLTNTESGVTLWESERDDQWKIH